LALRSQRGLLDQYTARSSDRHLAVLAGVLTETTAEIAAALTLAAARRVAEADVFMRGGHYKGWLPTLFVGLLLQNKTVGIIGAGRIGAAYARMMVEGHKMDLVYFDPYPNVKLEEYVTDYGQFLNERGERAVTVRRVETVEEVLRESDVCPPPPPPFVGPCLIVCFAVMHDTGAHACAESFGQLLWQLAADWACGHPLPFAW
jgi:hypothetical protein